jgi:hypothetical protein
MKGVFPMAKMEKNEALAMELTKLVVSTKPSAAADVFHISTDYLSIYRYILKDLQGRTSA